MNYLRLSIGLFFIILMIGCTQQENTKGNTVENHSPEQVDEKEQEAELLTAKETAAQIVRLLKTEDFVNLSKLIHPSKGVRFTPYGYIKEESDQIFKQTEVQGIWESETVLNWGEYDGTGDSIELTFKEYYKRFIYDADFENAEEIAVNKQLGQGNSIDNSKEVYPGSTIVEFHFPGFDEKYEGMDWRSLRVVLEQVDGRWYLIGVIHDQWTI
ncbi:hypothetical protein [Bacillus sp. LL01]|uniref:hypothetical protein n=1 Tax=Bacillus sp. LL01 TaxID=1665556 RepID=UPI000FFF0733|nr:hypothetical protein [Bacillus sp. LL01]